MKNTNDEEDTKKTIFTESPYIHCIDCSYCRINGEQFRVCVSRLGKDVLEKNKKELSECLSSLDKLKAEREEARIRLSNVEKANNDLFDSERKIFLRWITEQKEKESISSRRLFIEDNGLHFNATEYLVGYRKKKTKEEKELDNTIDRIDGKIFSENRRLEVSASISIDEATCNRTHCAKEKDVSDITDKRVGCGVGRDYRLDSSEDEIKTTESFNVSTVSILVKVRREKLFGKK